MRTRVSADEIYHQSQANSIAFGAPFGDDKLR
jgi:hypothetical protein